MHSLNCIGSVNDFSNFIGILKKCRDVSPVLSPVLSDKEYFFPQFSSNLSRVIKAVSSVGAV
jgi:hypothetical protein